MNRPLKSFKKNTLFIAIALTCGSNSSLLHAQEGGSKKGLVLEEVIVSATKRDETVNNVGVSVTAVSGLAASDLGQRNLDGIVKSIPNVNFIAGPSGSTLTVRGVGSAALDNVQSSVATFVDGVYVARSRNNSAPIFDTQQVEVLRGPQGALFGKNSIAGVFSITTAKPTQQFEGLVDVRAGNYDSSEGTLVLSGGLTDSLSARFAAFNRNTGDYLKNDLHQGDAGGTHAEAYRLSFAWTPSDNTDVGLKYEHFYNRLDNALTQLMALDPRDEAKLSSLGYNSVNTKLDKHMAAGTATEFGIRTGAQPNSTTKVGTNAITLTGTHTFDNEYELSATYGHVHSDFRDKYSNNDYPIVGIWIDSNVFSKVDNLDFRLSSPVQDQFHYTVGAYIDRTRDVTNHGYSQGNFESIGEPVLQGFIAGGAPAAILPSAATLAPALQVIVPGDGTNPSTTSSYALYTEGTYEFTDQWSLTVGARAALDKRNQKQSYAKRFDDNGNPLASPDAFLPLLPIPIQPIADGLAGVLQSFVVGPGTPDYNVSKLDKAFLPSGKIEYRPDVSTLIYFSLQSGYKNGGYNTATFSLPTTFNKERSIAAELGGKFSIADGRGQINAAIFETKFKDLQVGVVNPINGDVGFTNAATATSRGFEMDAHWLVIEQLQVGASYGYLDSRYDTFKNAACSINQLLAAEKTGAAATCTQDLSGRQTTHAPANTFSTFIDYRQPLGEAFELQANVTANYRDKGFSDLADSTQLETDYSTTVDARIALRNIVQKWSVALIGNNITDSQANVAGGSKGVNQSFGTYYGQLQTPATYWLALEKKF